MHLSHTHIGIAGAGLLGRLLAWRLTLLGHKVTLFEAGTLTQPTSAAYTAAAMISPMSEVVVSERAIYDMGMQSLSLWQNWMHDLPDSFQPLYKANGSVVVAHAQDASELEQFYNDLTYHLGSNNDSQWLDAQSLRAYEPDLSQNFEHGLYLPNESYLDNRAFLDQLLNYLLDAGVNVIDNCRINFDGEVSLTPNPNGPSHPNIDIKTFSHIDHWFDCRGIGAKSTQSVRGVRGEVIWVETDEVKLNRPIRLMHPRYKLYVVPKSHNRYILGATEIESEDTSPMSVQSALELCSALYSINPAFAEARILEIDTNLRPSLMDNMPCIHNSTIEYAGEHKPITCINGLYRHGYLLAPTLIEFAMKENHFIENTDIENAKLSYFKSVLTRNTLR